MATIQIPKARRPGDVTINIKLKDNGVAVDWSGLSDIRVFAYSEAQKAIAGECESHVDNSDHTKLVSVYGSDVPQYKGIAKVIVRAVYQGRVKTYDAPAVEFVDSTAETQGVEVLTDPTVNIQIEVSEVSTSLLDEAIAAALAAAASAQETEAEIEAAEAERETAEGNRETAEQAREAAEAAREDADAEREIQARVDHERAEDDHTRAGSDHATAAADHTRAESDHQNVQTALEEIAAAEGTIAENEAAREAAETARAERSLADHNRAEGDHTQAASDHTRAESDHGTAANDHTQAGTDHTRAESDHSTAASDHNTAGSDHQQAVSDHEQAVSDHSSLESTIEGFQDELDGKADTDNLKEGTIVPAYADNLKSWAERDALAIEDPWADPVRTTAGDTSVVSSEGSKLVSLVAKEDFYASAYKTSGFNLLHAATAVGNGYYFLVPAMAFGTYGLAIQPNGILFTDNAGENLTPTVRFKALSSGVPTSVSDGSICSYTDSNGLRFFTTPGPGYLIVSGITLAQTCAHVAWSGRYSEFIAPDAAADAGSSVSISSIIHAIHSFDRMLAIGGVADRIDFGESQATWTRKVDRVKPTWTNTELGDGAYSHAATISGMRTGGAVECGNLNLTVEGNTISYTDTNATATEDWVKYELATPATGNVTISPSVTIEDWGIEYFEGIVGSAYVTTQYAQGYPDSLALLVAGGGDKKFLALTEAAMELFEHLRALENINGLGDAKADSLQLREFPKVDLFPMVLIGAGTPSADVVPDNWDVNTMGEWTGIPCFIGQRYINRSATTKPAWDAVGNSAVTDWKQ